MEFNKLNPKEFEDFCYLLLSNDYPTITKVEGSGGDKGIDSYVGKIHNPEIIFQYKHFPNEKLSKSKRKDKILNDIEKASKLNPKRWFLLTSLSLNVTDLQWFNDKLISKYSDIEIQILDRSKLEYRALQPEIKKIMISKFPELYEYQNIIKELKENQIVLNLVEKGFAFYNKNDLEYSVSNDERSCWEIGYFNLKNINDGFDVRRKITNDILYQIIVEKNSLLLTGSPYSGKSTILKRVILELGDDKFLVFYSDSPPNIKSSNLKYSFSYLLKEYDRPILIIIDNFHTNYAIEFIKFLVEYNLPNLFFLFATSEIDYLNFQKSLGREGHDIVERINKGIKRIDVSLTELDGKDFFLKIVKVYNRNIKTPDVATFIQKIIEVSRKDLLIFLCSLKELVTSKEKPKFEDKRFEKCMESDFSHFINILKSEFIWNEYLPCIVLSSIGVKITADIEKTLDLDPLKVDRMVKNSLLVIDEGGFKRTKHEAWATGFLNYIIQNNFSNNIDAFIYRFELQKYLTMVLHRMDKGELIVTIERMGLISNKKFSLGRKLIEGITSNVYEKFSELDKSDIFCFGLAKFYVILEDYVNAVSSFKKSLKYNPDNFAALNNLANLYEYLKRYPDAIKYYKSAKSKNPNAPEPDYNISQIKYAQGKYKEALRYVKRSIKKDSEFISSLAVKGNILSELRKLNEAKKVYKKVLEKDKNNNLAILGLGNVAYYCLLEKYPGIDHNLLFSLRRQNLKIIHELFYYYNKYIQLYPYDKEGYHNLGKVQTVLGLYMTSIENMEKALKYDPDDVNILLSMMNNYLFIGDRKNMNSYVLKTLEVEPNNFTANINLYHNTKIQNHSQS